MFLIDQPVKKSQSKTPNILRTNKFQIALPDGWSDQSVYRFEGPEIDGIKHHININIDSQAKTDSVMEYAKLQAAVLSTSLQGYQSIKQGMTQLYNHHEAYENIFKWSPVDGQTLYQCCVYVIDKKTAYTLMSSFSKNSWKKVGKEIDLIMKSIVF